MKTEQRWECPKCGKTYEAPLAVFEVQCYDTGHVRKMKLIEGELPHRPKRTRRPVRKSESSRPYEGKANMEDLVKILEDIKDGE